MDTPSYLELWYASANVYVLYCAGHEIHGFHHIPEEGPALLIFYHGTVPIDFYYVMAKTLIEKQRQIHAVGDNFLFNIPGEFVIKIIDGSRYATYIKSSSSKLPHNSY